VALEEAVEKIAKADSLCGVQDERPPFEWRDPI